MIRNQDRDRTQQDSARRTYQTNYGSLNHENTHDASGCRAHRVKDGNVAAPLDYNQDQRGSDVQSGDANYEPDNHHTDPALKREGGEQRTIRFLPIDGRIGTRRAVASPGPRWS